MPQSLIITICVPALGLVIFLVFYHAISIFARFALNDRKTVRMKYSFVFWILMWILISILTLRFTVEEQDKITEYELHTFHRFLFLVRDWKYDKYNYTSDWQCLVFNRIWILTILYINLWLAYDKLCCGEGILPEATSEDVLERNCKAERNRPTLGWNVQCVNCSKANFNLIKSSRCKGLKHPTNFKQLLFTNLDEFVFIIVQSTGYRKYLKIRVELVLTCLQQRCRRGMPPTAD